jgi:hypothetical protein
MKSFIALPKKKINWGMFFQWFIFFPIILLIAVISGAVDGFIKTFKQAEKDVFEE